MDQEENLYAKQKFRGRVDKKISRFCWGCRTVKLLTEFHKDANDPSGVEARCKVCNKWSEQKKLNNDPNHIERRKMLMEMEMNNLIGAKDAAKLLDISLPTLYKLINTGKLKGMKLPIGYVVDAGAVQELRSQDNGIEKLLGKRGRPKKDRNLNLQGKTDR